MNVRVPERGLHEGEVNVGEFEGAKEGGVVHNSQGNVPPNLGSTSPCIEISLTAASHTKRTFKILRLIF